MPAPPVGWRLLARLMSDPRDRRFILADLEEEFQDMATSEEGVRRARRWYAAQVLRSIPSFVTRRARGLLHDGRQTTPTQNSTPPPDHPHPTKPGGSPAEIMIQNPLRTLRFAVRSLRKSPLLVLVTALSLTIGIGASTSVFTIVNAFLFQESQGLEDPESLIALYTSADHGGLFAESSFPDYLSVVDQAETLDGAVAFRAGFMAVDPPPGAPEGPIDRLIVEIVTGNYFDVLGISLPLGRGFLPEETRIGEALDLIVLSHDAWMDRFGGDPGALGRTLRLNNREFTVIGVGPQGLVSRMSRLKVDGWVPFGTPLGIWNATPQELASRRDHDLNILARLRSGATLDAAQSEMNLIAGRLLEAYPDAWVDNRGEPRSLTVLSEKDSQLPPDARRAMAAVGAMLMGGALLILLIACSNVASLFLARAQRRRREMAIRMSIGASRRRLLGMLLTESLLLGLTGGAGGLAVAWWFAEFMAALPFPLDVPLAFDIGLDARVVAFALTVGVVSSVVFGLAPALRGSRPNLVPALKADTTGGGSRPGRFSLRNMLVVGQVTASLVLLVTAGLFFRTVQNSTNLDVGFNPDRVAIMWKSLEEEYAGPEGAARFAREVEARLEALPEVEDVEVARRADASILDLADRAALEIPGYESPDGQPIVLSYTSITPGFAEMLELPILRGRTFTEADGPGTPGVALVNQAFVQRYWPGKDGIGESFTILERREVDTPTDAPPTVFQVVGVVRDQDPLTPGARRGPFLWIPFTQDHTSRAIIHVKGRTAAADMVPILRREIPLRPGEVPLIPAQTYDDAIRGRFLGHGIASKLLSWAGLFALALAVIGIFGIVSFAVTQRIREMAIRQAIGAPRRAVVRSLIWEGMFLTFVGLVVGLGITIPLGTLMRSLLVGVGPFDPLAVGGGSALLVAAAFAARVFPAHRVMKVDPLTVQREE